jgi:hypothetical protein
MARAARTKERRRRHDMSGTDVMTAEAPSQNKPPTLKLPWWKSALFVVIILSVMVVLFEGIVRVGFYFAEGRNPYYLTFGFVPDIEQHSAEFDGYTKFQPNSTYNYRVSDSLTFSMSINSDGFRSTTDFVRPKPAGTLRIVALGESSTFGLASNDDETYPYLLEQNLRKHTGRSNIEVYNLGIPHYRSNNILAVARAELAALEPDIVTFYAGYNNSAVLRPREEAGGAYAAKDWLKEHSVMYRAIHPYAVTAYSKLSTLVGRDVVGLPHLDLPVDLPADRVAQLRAAAVNEFRSDLTALADAVTAMGARFVLVTQSYTLRRLPGGLGLYDQWRPYDVEVAYVDSVLAARGTVPSAFSTLLIHRDLMQVLREVAQERQLLVIDGLSALDKNRERVMATYVHLTLEGNTVLAATIEEALMKAQMVNSAAHVATH